MSDVETAADARQTETITKVNRGKGGRPRKARGAANTSDAADSRWTVRGVPTNVRDMAVKAAERKGSTVGDYVAEAIIRAVRADEKGVSADEVSGLPAATVADTLKALNQRLTKLEAEKGVGFLGRLFGARSVAIVLVLALTAMGAKAADTARAFYNAQEYLDLDTSAQAYYAAGAYDSLVSSSDFRWAQGCIKGWSLKQLGAVFTKYLRDHPDKWHELAAPQILWAVGQGCSTAPPAVRSP